MDTCIKIRIEDNINIRVYGNVEKAELFVNGDSKGVKSQIEKGIFIWKNLQLPEGENKILVKETKGSIQVEDVCIWYIVPNANFIDHKFKILIPNSESGDHEWQYTSVRRDYEWTNQTE